MSAAKVGASAASGVWRDLVGQEPTVEVLRGAVSAAATALHGDSGSPAAGTRSGGMTHAWLLTGPPGSGRSNAARAFAAALQCPHGGCGECLACRTALAGSHPDVSLVSTERLSLGVDEVRELVRRAAMSPTGDRWQVVVVEDADRLTERAADALLKSVEEPATRTVWLLCAPTAEDVVPTIRSRCRLLVLRTPPPAAVAQVLTQRDGVSAEVATFAARASQGHIGRARALAGDEDTRNRRREVLGLPTRLRDLGACMTAAANLVDAANEEAAPISARLDGTERSDLEQALGMGTRGVKARGTQGALKEMEDQQKARGKRLQRDALDRALVDLMSFYRDVLVLQTGGGVDLVNEESRRDVESVARAGTAESTVRRIQAILDCREALEGSVAPLLALEALMIALARGR
ncbi:MAG TPA: DNA polymerase III subunit delta' [Nocardioidaceae bacterium]|nr:DNA polymerase III subunit delta' [Nocardioidaceae bacterium]